jgi:hypothetical protein
MNPKLNAGFLTICFLAFTFPAFAQADGSTLAADIRARHGPPLGKEIFVVPPGEMVVYYSQSGNACRIQLPAAAQHSLQPDVKSIKAVDDFLLTLAPLNMRGKELRKMHTDSGQHGLSMVEYENVTIAESMPGDRRTGITVTF